MTLNYEEPIKVAIICMIDEECESIHNEVIKADNEEELKEIVKGLIFEDHISDGGSLFLRRRGRGGRPGEIYGTNYVIFDHSIGFGVNCAVRYVWYAAN